MFVEDVQVMRRIGVAMFAALLAVGQVTITKVDSSFAQEPQEQAAAKSDSVESDDEEQERIVSERFLELLMKRPRPGTALEKVYAYHVQRGTLDKFCDDLLDEATKNARGESWLLLGLVQSQRNKDSDALIALQKAEELLPDDAMASYYLGKSHSLVGSSDLAVAAMERAIKKMPIKTEMLQILQDLGRIYQRMGRTKEATEVWQNLEENFPGDARIKEQIASILAEEGATAEALARYQTLASATNDRFRKVELSLWAAQLKETLGRRDEALADFESLLGQVNPDSWMHQDLRGRIDRMFTSRNDYDGLAKYYQRWIETHPDDVDAMLRIGRFLAIQRRTPEAKEWFAKAIERVPSNPEPRLALVDTYEREKQFGPAAEAMKKVVDIAPDNIDYIVRLGSLLFANQDVAQAERARSAAAVWNKLLEKRSDDPLTVSRVADLLRGADLVDEAINAYRQAISLAENEPQYREYLGEFLFRLNRKEEALKVWRELASGPRENRDNLVRLSEVLASFHFDEEALATMDRACANQPTLDHRIRYTKMLRRATKYDKAIEQLVWAESLADSADERSLVIDQQIETYQASGQLQSKIAEIEAAAKDSEKDNPVTWQKLALLQEADRKFQQAATSIARAVELQPQSSLLLNIEARVLEKAGMFAEAIDSLRKVAAIDRRYKSNYLMQIAALEMRTGRMKAALATGQELITGSTANSEHFKFFADMCFQAGEEAQGLDALRRNLRRNPNDRDALRSLASKLSSSTDNTEAIELYWRSCAAATSIDERRDDVLALLPLYQRQDQIEQLIERLTKLGRELGNEREATLLVVSVRQATGDMLSARTLLESLVTEESRDVALLDTLIQLAVRENDWEGAARYQRQLNTSSPTPEGEFRLAKFLIEGGEVDEPMAIWSRLDKDTPTSERITQVVELLVKRNENRKAIEFAEGSLNRDPDNWEVMTAVMLAMWKCSESDRAAALADRLLQIKLPFDTPTAQFQKRASSPANSPTGANGNAASAVVKSIDLSSRKAWLERFMTNYRTILMRQTQVASGSNIVRSQLSLPTTIYSFGDAKILADFLKRNAHIAKNPRAGRIDFQPLTYKPELIDLGINTETIWDSKIADLCIEAFGYESEINGPTFEQLLTRLVELGDPEAPLMLLESHYYLRLVSRRNPNATGMQQVLPKNMISLLYTRLAIQRRINQAQAQAQLGGADVLSERLKVDEINRLIELFEQTIAKTGSSGEQVDYLLWFAHEFQLVGDETRTSEFVAKARELTAGKPSQSQLLSFLPFDRAFVINSFAESIVQGTTPASTNSQVPHAIETATFLNELLTGCKDPNEIAVLCKTMIESQVGSARKLRPSQLAVYDPTRKVTYYYAVSLALSGASRTSSSQIVFPCPSALQSAELLTVLYALHTTGKVDVKEAVRKQLAEDAAAPDEEALKSAVDRLCYASWLWWAGSKSDAIEQMNEYRKLGVATEVGIMVQCQMLINLNRGAEVVELLDSFNPTDPKLLEYREFTIMNLTSNREDPARAKLAVERLYAMPLAGATQLRVSEAMDHLGMKDMSAAVIQRLRRGGTNDLPTMYQLMMTLNKSEDKADKKSAVEFAWKIYQRTQPVARAVVQGSQTRPTPVTAPRLNNGQEYRNSTIRVLVEAGETDALIKSLETQVEKASTNSTLVFQLAELYRATGKVDQADELMGTYVVTNYSAASSVISSMESEEEFAIKAAKIRLVMFNEFMSHDSTESDARIKRLNMELFTATIDKRKALENLKLASMVLGTESVESRAKKSKLQQWLERAASSTEEKDSLKQLVKDLESKPATERTLPQLVMMACIANAAEDKEATVRIANSIVAHPKAAFSVSALISKGRETTWAAVPILMKLGEADLAIKLAQIAITPPSEEVTEALRSHLELATLQLDVGKTSDAELTLRNMTSKFSKQSKRDLAAMSKVAIELAKFAAEKGLFQVSFDAAVRASMLGATGSDGLNERLLSLIELWKEKQIPADRVYETMKEIVFCGNDPSRWRLYPDVTRNYGGSHDFTFPEKKAKPLAFLLVDLAKANNSLPPLIELIDRHTGNPSLRTSLMIVKAYALRASGNTAEATKLLEEIVDSPKSLAEEIFFLFAFSPIPGSDESTNVPPDAAGPMLKKFMNGRIMHTGTRHALLNQIRQYIASDDRAMLDCYVAAAADAIPMGQNFDSESLKLMLRQFYTSLSGECTAQGKTDLAAEYLERAK